jgi:hypothetical protein
MRERRYSSTILDPDTTWRFGQLHAPAALPQGKELPEPGWASTAGLDALPEIETGPSIP